MRPQRFAAFSTSGKTGIEPALLAALALKLGADVPMCLDGRPLIASGIGEADRARCH